MMKLTVPLVSSFTQPTLVGSPAEVSDVLLRTYDDQVCSLARAWEVVGERWSLLIVATPCSG
jgi:hypothetical protein